MTEYETALVAGFYLLDSPPVFGHVSEDRRVTFSELPKNNKTFKNYPPDRRAVSWWRKQIDPRSR